MKLVERRRLDLDQHEGDGEAARLRNEAEDPFARLRAAFAQEPIEHHEDGRRAGVPARREVAVPALPRDRQAQFAQGMFDVALDLDGTSVVPGLVDAHVHLVWAGGRDPVRLVEEEGEREGVLVHSREYFELEDFGKPGNYFERQVMRWTRQYRDSETDYLPEMERLIAFLPQTLPEQSRTSIVHGDYRIDNVVFDGDGTLTAVLDWELATLGDPVADFSYLAMQWVMPADGGAGLGGLDLAALGIPSLEAIAQRYSERSGVPVEARLDWYFAYNLFRLAGIVQGIKKRLADGTASHANAAEIAARVPGAAKVLTQALRARGLHAVLLNLDRLAADGRHRAPGIRAGGDRKPHARRQPRAERPSRRQLRRLHLLSGLQPHRHPRATMASTATFLTRWAVASSMPPPCSSGSASCGPSATSRP